MAERLIVPICQSTTYLPSEAGSILTGSTISEVIFADGTRYFDLAFHQRGVEDDHFPSFTGLDGTRLEAPHPLSRYPTTRQVVDRLTGLMVDYYEATGSLPPALFE